MDGCGANQNASFFLLLLKNSSSDSSRLIVDPLSHTHAHQHIDRVIAKKKNFHQQQHREPPHSICRTLPSKVTPRRLPRPTAPRRPSQCTTRRSPRTRPSSRHRRRVAVKRVSWLELWPHCAVAVPASVSKIAASAYAHASQSTATPREDKG